MHVLLMGTAAGGGFPQWNCWCPCCRTARTNPEAAHPRTQSAAAVSADGRRWFLLNASPDIHRQLGWLPSSGAPTELRHVPVEGVLLTDAELDHSLGVVLLREARSLRLYTTAAVGAILEHDSRILSLARVFADVQLTELRLDAPVGLDSRDGSASGLTVEAFAVPAGPPRFAPKAGEGHTVGLLLREPKRGVACAFVPGCGGLTEPLMERLEEAHAVLFDGTFWSDRELVDLGIATRTAREMDHTPVGGPGGSLERLAALTCRHRIYTHINNSNPMLLEDSPERAAVVGAGWTVGFDGLHITL